MRLLKLAATLAGAILPGDATLLSVFKKGIESLNISLDTSSSENPWASNSETEKGAKDPVEDSPVFLKFLENVTKKGYFNDAKEGSEEYSRRYQKVLAKFKSRMDAKKRRLLVQTMERRVREVGSRRQKIWLPRWRRRTRRRRRVTHP